METVTIRQAQHNFASLIHKVEQGEEVRISRRSKPVARLVSIESVDEKVDWSHAGKRRQAIFHGKRIKGAPVSEVIAEARGET